VQNLTRKPKKRSEMVGNEEQRRPETKPDPGAMEQGRSRSVELGDERRGERKRNGAAAEGGRLEERRMLGFPGCPRWGSCSWGKGGESWRRRTRAAWGAR
jgi:hypothetical protein